LDSFAEFGELVLVWGGEAFGMFGGGIAAVLERVDGSRIYVDVS